MPTWLLGIISQPGSLDNGSDATIAVGSCAAFGGLAHVMPVYATFFMITTLASIGLPGLAGFVGEFMILFGSFGSTTLPHARLLTVLAATGVVLGAIYMLWMYQRVFLGKLANEKNRGLNDLTAREVMVLLPLIVFMFVLGVRPQLVLDRVEASVERVLAPVAPVTASPHAGLETPASAPEFVLRDTESQ